jgi:hypothetical protein
MQFTPQFHGTLMYAYYISFRWSYSSYTPFLVRHFGFWDRNLDYTLPSLFFSCVGAVVFLLCT